MITVRKEFSSASVYPLERIGSPESIAFFDIETTGFSGTRDRLYLIGCVWREDSAWKLIQWFADEENSEADLLRAFFDFLKNFQILVHFNGDGFDIPFILKRCAAHGIACDFSNIRSFDIYRGIRPLRRLLGLESLKQKSIENFLGIVRTDRFTGGQLIEVYQEYLSSRDSRLEHLLLLHNEDDLKGMPSILPILFYPDFLRGPFTFLGLEIREIPDFRGQKERELVLSYGGPGCLPVPADFSSGCFSLSLSENRITLSVPLREGEMKRFYEDYRNYYYLIYEDCAVHKSVGQYVDRDARKKATARTCYTRVKGIFLPWVLPGRNDLLKAEYRDKTGYIPYTDTVFADNKTAVRYLEAVLSSFMDCSG